MIDYQDMGRRIRDIRLAKGITQEQLANAIDVGVTHISHIETGAAAPSLKTFVGIVNALGCSADELLCRDVDTARPIFLNWFSELISDCTEWEAKILADTVVAVKASMRRNITSD